MQVIRETTKIIKPLCFRYSFVMHYCPMSYDFLFHFWNSHQATCLRSQAILNSGSGRWKKGTFPRETNWAQSRVLKQIQINNPGLRLEILSCLSAPETPNSSQSLPNPGAKTSPVILHDSQSKKRKLNLSAKALMHWQMRPPCGLQAVQTLMRLQVLGAAVEQILEGFL